MSKIIVDAHCDTISRIYNEGGELKKNSYQVDLNKIGKQNHNVQFFALFKDKSKAKTNILVDILGMLDKLYNEVEKNKDKIDIALTSDDVTKISDEGKTSCIISLEGGDALCGNIAILRMLYKLGVRCVTLTWNFKNEIGCGILEKTDTGVTDFGFEVIDEMNRLGMIIDISHIGELGFWNVLNYTNVPIIASHSNVRKLCNNKRNLFDEQIKAIAEHNGFIGINYNPDFLNDSGEATMLDVMLHIEYICSLVGTQYVGLGSDFDGIEKHTKGLENISKVDNILNELAKKNYSQDDIDKIASCNILRVIKEVVK